MVKPHKHRPIQHRDGKPPWCEECGLTRDLKEPISKLDNPTFKERPMTTVETTKYVRKPFEVEAVQVTDENMEAVKDWCHGTLEVDNRGNEERPYIKVRVARALNERQTKAFVGDWVLYAGTGFKVYTSKAFHKTFEQQDKPKELLTTAEPIESD